MSPGCNAMLLCRIALLCQDGRNDGDEDGERRRDETMGRDTPIIEYRKSLMPRHSTYMHEDLRIFPFLSCVPKFFPLHKHTLNH